MNTLRCRLFLPVATLLLAIVSPTTLAASLSDGSSRAGKWALNFTSQYLDTNRIDMDGGAKLEISDTVGWGFGFGYNFDEHLELVFDMTWSNRSYKATAIENGAPRVYGNDLYSSTMNLGLTYNFMPRRFTPFVTGVVGWTFMDTNIPDGPPQNGCWWDPWWGYICGVYQPTRTEDHFTWGALAGLRFDVARSLYLKGAIGKHYLDIGAGGRQDVTLFRFNIGWMFR